MAGPWRTARSRQGGPAVGGRGSPEARSSCHAGPTGGHEYTRLCLPRFTGGPRPRAEGAGLELCVPVLAGPLASILHL